ncbi:hypothetical protein AGMMS49959_19180 [Planctomycetales bacterium]|nr:hypothetical protein AGMMS49959_19180 [Planctomycetales bacterium]
MPPTLARARFALVALFVAYGVTYLSFISRLVKIREELGGITPAELAVILFAASVGDVVASPLCGYFLERLGIRAVIRFGGTAMAVWLTLFALCTGAGWYYADIGLAFLLGASLGCVNIAMNMAGVAIERRAEQTLMPFFHAFFCLGAVLATTISHFTVQLSLGILPQYVAVGAVMIGVAHYAAHNVFEFHDKKEDKGGGRQLDRALILLILLMMAVALTEGCGNDWIVLGAVEAFTVSEATAIGALWIYLFFETTTRFAGRRLTQRFGEINCLRGSFVAALAGVLLYIATPELWGVWVATALWGAGVALGYPLVISMAAASGENPSFRASLVVALGTIMNIAAPPAIGLIANFTGIRHALIVLLVPLTVGFAVVFFSSLARRKSGHADAPAQLLR